MSRNELRPRNTVDITESEPDEVEVYRRTVHRDLGIVLLRRCRQRRRHQVAHLRYGGITTTIKHATKLTLKLKTTSGPAKLAQLLQPSLAFCCTLQPMTAYRTVVQCASLA